MSEQEQEKRSVYSIPVPGPEEKVVRVYFPTDEQWIERRRRKKIMLRQNGEFIPTEYEDVDAALVASIRADGGQPEIQPAEAEYVMEQIAQADVRDVIKEGNCYRIVLQVPGEETTHTLRIPSVPEIKAYRRKASSSLTTGRNRQQVTIHLEAAAEFYSKLEPKYTGYNGTGPPAIHQAAVLEALIEEVQSPTAHREKEKSPANF